MGLLERAHSYKDKLAKGIKPSVGLFTYPILMASDILIYDAEIVPVGRPSTTRGNDPRHGGPSQQYGAKFKRPEPLIANPKVPAPMAKRCLRVMAIPFPFLPKASRQKMSTASSQTPVSPMPQKPR